MRVKPEVVRVEPSVLTTTFQWTFQLNVDERIKTFRVICQDEAGKSIEVKEKLTLKNVAKFKNNLLEPNTKYHVKVAAVYTDGFEAESAQLPFTTLGIHNVQIMLHYILYSQPAYLPVISLLLLSHEELQKPR